MEKTWYKNLVPDLPTMSIKGKLRLHDSKTEDLSPFYRFVKPRTECVKRTRRMEREGEPVGLNTHYDESFSNQISEILQSTLLYSL